MIRWISLLILVLFANTSFADEPSEKLIAALIQVESSNRDAPEPGDKLDKYGNLVPESEWAYGPLQIRGVCIRDYNRIYGTNYRAQDCHGNRALSIQICKGYIDYYATKKRCGRIPTDEDKARIWNGGPSGWKRKVATEDHWTKVKKHLK